MDQGYEGEGAPIERLVGDLSAAIGCQEEILVQHETKISSVLDNRTTEGGPVSNAPAPPVGNSAIAMTLLDLLGRVRRNNDKLVELGDRVEL